MVGSKVKTHLMIGIWALACAGGFSALAWYKQLPGPVGVIKDHWPQNITLEYSRNQYNLVLFAHPKCGCTKATLVELEKLMSETKNKMDVKIFFYHPKDTSASWADTDSKKAAMKISGIKVFTDRGGELARRFGAMTSGQVMVYSPEGDLAYAGGITESRGHIGDNQGSRSIASVVDTGIAQISKNATFGCILYTEDELKDYKKAGIN